MNQSYHLRTSDLADLAGACPEGSLAANHGAAVGKHGDADEGVAVGVPADNGILVVVLGCLLILTEFLLHVLLGLHRQVNVGNLQVHGGDQLDPCDLGDDAEDFGVLPCVVHERSMSAVSHQQESDKKVSIHPQDISYLFAKPLSWQCARLLDTL